MEQRIEFNELGLRKFQAFGVLTEKWMQAKSPTECVYGWRARVCTNVQRTFN